jgi:Tfp pilus assembly protein PilF
MKLHRNSIEKLMKRSNDEEAALELEKWLDMDPDNLDYYIELMNIYQRMGYNDRAIGVGNRGLEHSPGNATLTNKVIGLLTEMGNYSQALKIARKSSSGSVYTGLLQEAAEEARLNDPYEMNGRLYAKTHDRDALNYLLNTSLTRGYYDDARTYLAEAMKRDGRTTPLLMKLYTLEKRTGNENAMRKVLQELYFSSPDDNELKETYADMMLHLGTMEMSQQQWADADNHLLRAIELMPVSHESWPAAVSMRITVWHT